MSSLFTLPPEVLTLVFELLEGRQIARCGTVSGHRVSLLLHP
jgi:F-box-like